MEVASVMCEVIIILLINKIFKKFKTINYIGADDYL